MPRAKKQHLKQRADGRYACRYKGKWFMGWSEDEALDARKAYKDAEKAGQLRLLAVGPSVGEYAARWISVHKASVSKKTYNDYAKQLDALTSALGSMSLKEVTPTDAKSVYAHYQGYSDSTIRRARMLYVSMFASAVEDGWIHRNPFTAETARPHRGTVGTHRALTREEDQLILSVQSPLRLAVLAMRYAGLRRGEALALDIDRDVDFKRRIITVREALRFDGNRGEIAPPKTENAYREIPLLDVLADALKDHHGLLATSAQGKMMSEIAFRRAWESWINDLERSLNGGYDRRWYGRTKEHQALQARGELPPYRTVNIRPHDLRHSYCTMLRDAGVDMKLAILWLGHADEKMVLRVYDHPTASRAQAAVDNLNALLK